MSPRHVGAGNLTGALWKRTLKRRTTSSPRKKYCSPTSPTRKTISALLEISKHPLKSSTRSAHRYALSPQSSHSYAKDAIPARCSCCGALRGFSWVKVSDPENTMTQHIDVAGAQGLWLEAFLSPFTRSAVIPALGRQTNGSRIQDHPVVSSRPTLFILYGRNLPPGPLCQQNEIRLLCTQFSGMGSS